MKRFIAFPKCIICLMIIVVFSMISSSSLGELVSVEYNLDVVPVENIEDFYGNWQCVFVTNEGITYSYENLLRVVLKSEVELSDAELDGFIASNQIYLNICREKVCSYMGNNEPQETKVFYLENGKLVLLYGSESVILEKLSDGNLCLSNSGGEYIFQKESLSDSDEKSADGEAIKGESLYLGTGKDALKELVSFNKIDLSLHDYSGYRMALASSREDLASVDPDDFSKDRKVYYFNLSEEECSSFFTGVTPVSVGPNNSILWLREEDSGNRILFVQRENDLIPLSPASNRGAIDTAELLIQELYIKLNINKELIDGTFRWSSDGRYLFINDYQYMGVYYSFIDPYIIDTVTGEIFLVETDGQDKVINPKNKYQYLTNGRFSKDSQNFVYSMTIGNGDSSKSSILKKYNMESGTISEMYKTEKTICDFCEMKSDHWLIIEADEEGNRELVRFSDVNSICEYEKINTPYGNPQFIPVNDELVLLHLRSGSYYSSFKILEWDKTISEDKWYVIQDVVDEKMTPLSVEEVNEREDYANPRYWTTLPDNQMETIPFTSCVTGVLVDDEYPYLLLRCEINREIPDTWNGLKEMLHCVIALNVETLDLYPIVISGEDIGSFTDEIVYDNYVVLGSGHLFNTFSIFHMDGDIKHWYEIKQSKEEFIQDDIYTCSNGSYVVVSEKEPIKLKAYCIETVDVEVDSVISVTDDGYNIVNTFTPIKEKPEYIIPKAIGADRFEEYLGKMSKKNKKRVVSNYKMYTPEKITDLHNIDELMKKYPSIIKEKMYILRTDIDNSNLAKLEDCFKEVGYDYDDYLTDLENIVGESGFITRYPIEYSFEGESNISRTEALRLAGLCDAINSKIYNEYYNGNDSEKPVASEQKDLVSSILQSRQQKITKASIKEMIYSAYIIEGCVYGVKIEEIVVKDNDLELILSVSFSNSYVEMAR